MADINRYDTEAHYTHEYSQFPTHVMEQTNYKDVNDDVSELVNNIKKARADGQYAEAADMVKRNINKLKNMFISAVDINRLVEEIRNTQIFAIKKRKMIYVDSAEPEAEFEGDVWIDIDNTIEDPERNGDMVVEKNKTTEDYEAEIERLKDTYSAIENTRNEIIAKNAEIERISAAYETLRQITESSSTELQENYQTLLREDGEHNTALGEVLEANGVNVHKINNTVETDWNNLIQKVYDVRSDGSLYDTMSELKSQYVPKGETWYANGIMHTGLADVFEPINLSPKTRDQGKYIGKAGFYKGIKIDCDSLYNAAYTEGFEQGRDTGSLKTIKLGSITAGTSNNAFDGVYSFDIPRNLQSLNITIDNINVVPTGLVLNANSAYVYEESAIADPNMVMPTPEKPYNETTDASPFSLTLDENTLTVTVNKVTITGQDGQALARAWVSADVYVQYMEK